MKHQSLLILTACLLLASSTALADSEAVAFGVNNFNGSGQCEARDASGTDLDLSYCDDFVDAFVARLTAAGFDQVEDYMNSAVDGRDWTDSSKQSFGDDELDPYGTDFADVTMLCSHGSQKHVDGKYYSAFKMGDDNSSETCDPRTDTHLKLGDGSNGDTEVAILGTCLSAQLPVWEAGGYDQVLSSSGTFSSWLGFHGLSIDSSTDANHFDSYLKNSISDGLGDNWLDKMYRSISSGDECPVAIFYCEREADCEDQHIWGGLMDRFKIDSSDTKAVSQYWYIDGCDPVWGDEL